MGYAIGELRRWDTGGLGAAGTAVAAREAEAEDARRILSDGREAMGEGWDGLAAEAVLDAAEAEKSHVTKLADGLHDLADALARAEAALGPAVQTVRNRIADAEAAGLVVGDASVAPAPGRTDIEQHTVDGHAAAIRAAIDTVISLDEHYGREIDTIAEKLHSAIPAEVDRAPIPGPDDPWPGRAVDAVTGALQLGLTHKASEVDPATRGAHALIHATDDAASSAARGMSAMAKVAGPLGNVMTVVGGVMDYAEGKTTEGEAALETGGALGGGMAGGALAGAAAGSFFGPLGTALGAGIGAAVGSELGKKAGSEIYDRWFDGDED